MVSRLVCFTVLFVFLLGCGADDPEAPGEEVVSETWKELKDIGKECTATGNLDHSLI